MFCTPIVLCLLNCITGQGHMWPLVIPALDDRKKKQKNSISDNVVHHRQNPVELKQFVFL
jgi:hypothetical protein